LLNFYFNYQYKHNNAEGVKNEEAATKTNSEKPTETERERVTFMF